MQAQIDVWRDEYGVDTSEALRAHGDAADSPQDTISPHQTANEWELVEHRLDIVTDAIVLLEHDQ